MSGMMALNGIDKDNFFFLSLRQYGSAPTFLSSPEAI